MIFTPLDKNNRDAILEKFYKNLGHYPENILKKAVDILIADYTYKRFPLIHEIKEAIGEVSSEGDFIETREKDTVSCSICGGTGRIIKDVPHENRIYPTAYPCKCAAGERWRKRFENYQRR